MQKKEVLYQNKKITYLLNGEGPTVVLLHGFGENGMIWKAQIEALPDYKLIVPHLPGTEKSEMIDNMSMEGMAACIHFILKEEKIERCSMIGHSMGGYITLAFVEQYPNMLSGYGLFHSSSFADNEEKKKTRLKGIDFIDSHGAFEFLKTTIPNLYSDNTKAIKPELPEDHLKSVEKADKAALKAYYRSMMERKDRTYLLKQNKLPVLFVIGKHDNAVPMEDSLKQSHLPILSYVHILNDSGHMGMVEEPEISNNYIDEFLKHTAKDLRSA